MPTQNINLPTDLSRFVESQIAEGRFRDANEVHNAALSAMAQAEEEREAKSVEFLAEIQKGVDDIEAGRFTTLKSKSDIREYMDECYEGAMKSLAEENAEVLR